MSCECLPLPRVPTCAARQGQARGRAQRGTWSHQNALTQPSCLTTTAATMSQQITQPSNRIKPIHIFIVRLEDNEKDFQIVCCNNKVLK